MQSATLTRPRPVAPAPGRADDRARTKRWAWVAFGILCLAALVGFLAFPTYPNYDSYYSLLWGRELLHGHLPVYETYRAPTPHPLAIAIGAVLSPLGHDAERVWILLCVASFVALVAGVYRLARDAFTPLVGFVAAALLLSRFDFAFYAARGYIDIGYMALVVWAAVLEARRPRCGAPVLALLAIAGLLRPEAWVMSGLYWLWVCWRASWRDRALFTALAAVGPVLWAGSDWAVTGDPLYSLTYTSSFAEELGRAQGAQGVPAATWEFLVKLDKLPVLLGGMIGVVLAVLLVPRRAVMPLVLLTVGIGTFALVGAGGFSVIDRYLLVSSLMMMVFCAVTLAGWTMLRERSRVRRGWMVGAALFVCFGVVFTAIKVNVTRLENELRFRGDAHRALHAVLDTRAVREGLRCGPISVPNHKLIPDVRWLEDLPPRDVIARSQALGHGRAARRARARIQRGVALYPVQRSALLRQALVSDADKPESVLPLPGFTREAGSTYYAAYVRC